MLGSETVSCVAKSGDANLNGSHLKVQQATPGYPALVLELVPERQARLTKSNRSFQRVCGRDLPIDGTNIWRPR